MSFPEEHIISLLSSNLDVSNDEQKYFENLNKEDYSHFAEGLLPRLKSQYPDPTFFELITELKEEIKSGKLDIEFDDTGFTTSHKLNAEFIRRCHVGNTIYQLSPFYNLYGISLNDTLDGLLRVIKLSMEFNHEENNEFADLYLYTLIFANLMIDLSN